MGTLLNITLYRVVLDNFKNINDCLNILNTLKLKGFDCDIISTDTNTYMLQFGTFKNKNNANELSYNLNNLGFNTKVI